MFGAISDDARGLQPIVSLLRATLESTADGSSSSNATAAS